MKEMKNFTFKKTTDNEKCGLSGKTISVEVPKFDWEAFKSNPNARFFCKKMFEAEVTKIVREMLCEKNGTTDNDLSDMNSVIMRTLPKPTVTDISEWIDSQDWSDCQFPRGEDTARDALKKELPKIVSGKAVRDKKKLEKIQKHITDIRNIESNDYIAEYLWSKIDVLTKENDLLPLDDL